MIKETTISSIQELIAAIEDDHGTYTGSLWYRGQAEKEWSLKPGYLRLSSPTSESTLLKRFKQSAVMLLEKDPKDSFDWLFLMQHHGVPTRLLDWTESPLIALYFALSNYQNHPGKDAIVWSLRPCELNKNANIVDSNEEFFIPSFEDEELKNYKVETLASNTRVKSLPVASIATRNNSRLQAQLGVFTIHHLDHRGIEEIGDQSHVIKYIIPNEKRQIIYKQLGLLGFSKFTMFPELSSIGENIRINLI